MSGSARARRSLAALTVAGVVALAGCASSDRPQLQAAPSTAPLPPTTLHPTTTTTTVAPLPPPASKVPVPRVSGPVRGGQPDAPVNAMPATWSQQYGYFEQEFFVEGRARDYSYLWAQPADGRWFALPFSTQPYRTRIVVRTPSDPGRFNGTVYVEWLNDTPGRDTDTEFALAGPAMMRAGAAWVGVSAQRVGVLGGPGVRVRVPGDDAQPLVRQNPARYRSLRHPGDDFSYDIFSQVAQALWRPDGVTPLGSLRPRYVIAIGASQAAARLVTYYNAIQPKARVFSAFLIHGRGAGAAPISTTLPVQPLPSPARLRTDQPVPVIVAETETDFALAGFAAAEQPDTAHMRTWEMAGTSTNDRTTIAYDTASRAVWNPGPPTVDAAKVCGKPVNDGPQGEIVSGAAIALSRWVQLKKAPPRQPRFTLQDGAVFRDFLGNAFGGVRLPQLVAPTKVYSASTPDPPTLWCAYVGTARRLPLATLRSLYRTRDDYILQVQVSAGHSVQTGTLTANDAATIINKASKAKVR